MMGWVIGGLVLAGAFLVVVSVWAYMAHDDGHAARLQSIADEGAAQRRAIGAAYIRSLGQQTDLDRDALASRYRYEVIDGKVHLVD